MLETMVVLLNSCQLGCLKCIVIRCTSRVELLWIVQRYSRVICDSELCFSISSKRLAQSHICNYSGTGSSLLYKLQSITNKQQQGSIYIMERRSSRTKDLTKAEWTFFIHIVPIWSKTISGSKRSHQRGDDVEPAPLGLNTASIDTPINMSTPI